MNPCVHSVSIRAACPADVRAIVRIHCLAFPRAFLTDMGPDFLGAYYRLVHDDPGGILLVHQAEDGVDGFVAGFAEPVAFYRRMKRARARLIRSMILAMCRKPWLAGRIFYHVRNLAAGNSRRAADGCELSSLAVAPRGQSRGTGRLLVEAFLENAWNKNAQRVFLTTEARANERTNLFYQRLGFELEESYRQYRDRVLNQYVFYRVGK